MKRIELGKNVEQKKGFKSFIPYRFPPKDGFDFDSRLFKKVDQATRLLGKPDGITKLLPDAACRADRHGILSPKDKDKKYGQSYIYKRYTHIFAEKK